MQAASDIFSAGSASSYLTAAIETSMSRALGLEGVRRLRDDEPRDLRIYASICAWKLARAHARSGSATDIGAYLGGSDVFDQALGDFARSYAKQNDHDYQALLDAIASGTLTAESGI